MSECPETDRSESTTLLQLCEMVGGTLRGDAETSIDNAWPIGDATLGSITLIDSLDRINRLEDCPATAVILPEGAPDVGIPSILSDKPHDAFETIVRSFRNPPAPKPAGIHPTAVIDPTAKISTLASIGAGVFIGAETIIESGVSIGANSVVEERCRIGADTWIAPNVTIAWGTLVGRECRLHSGVVLGADGFGYRQVEGRHELAAQIGTVELEDRVEIGANSCVDRGGYGPTRVGEGTKVDNFVQIAHNCQIGKHNLLCSHVGIAGSSTTGDYVVMAGQVGVRDHVNIGAGAIISGQAGVTNHVPEGAVMLGSPAIPMRDQKLQFAAVSKLPQLRKEFKQMRKELDALMQQIQEASTLDQTTDRAA